MSIVTAALTAIAEFCKAYCAWAALEQRKYLATLEDETQAALDLHTPEC